MQFQDDELQNQSEYVIEYVVIQIHYNEYVVYYNSFPNCTSAKNGPSAVERDCHDKWKLLKSKIDALHGSSNEQFLIRLFAESEVSVGGIQLNHHNITALNKPMSRLPSYGGLFCSVILKFCNEKIEYYETELSRRQQHQF